MLQTSTLNSFDNRSISSIRSGSSSGRKTVVVEIPVVPSIQTHSNTTNPVVQSNTASTMSINETMGSQLGMNYAINLMEQESQLLSNDNDDNNYNNDMDDVSDDNFVINVPQSKTSIKNGPGFESVRKKDGCWIKPCYFSKYTSCVIDNTPEEVISGLLIICAYYATGVAVFEDNENEINNNNNNGSSINTFAREMEYQVNSKDFIIDGIAFINHKAINFVISIWHDNEDMNVFSPVRVEFQKIRGDCGLFHLFWCEMLELMFTFTLENKKRLFGQISECTRSGKSCLETFLVPLSLTLPLLPVPIETMETEIIDTELEMEMEIGIGIAKEDKFKLMEIDSDRDGNYKDNENEKKKDEMNNDDSDDSDGYFDDCGINVNVKNGKNGKNDEWANVKEVKYGYEYSKGDLDDMAFDLMNNYRNEGLDVLAKICNTLESNLKFHKLLCENKKLIKIIANDIIIINRENNCNNNCNMLRGGLCVLVKLIGKYGKNSELQLEFEEEREEKTFEKEIKLQQHRKRKTTTKTIRRGGKENQPGRVIPSKIVVSDIGNDVDTTNITETTGTSINTSNSSSSSSSSSSTNSGGKMSGEIELTCVIEFLVNETHLIQQFPLLIQNSSKIIQNHTIRLMKLIFDYIPEKLKLTKNNINININVDDDDDDDEINFINYDKK